jgi:hypothetical protein
MKPALKTSHKTINYGYKTVSQTHNFTAKTPQHFETQNQESTIQKP